MDTDRIDIGHGLKAALRLSEGFPGLEDGIPVGLLLTHACKMRGGETVEDFIPIDYPGCVSGLHWQLVERSPITLRPSVAYTCCDVHGFITGGTWKPA